MNKFFTTALLLLITFTSCKKNKALEPFLGDSEDKTPTISIIAPTSVYVNSIVTITGKNFGTEPFRVQVLFNGILGTNQTITDTEIKVAVPVTTTGVVTVVIGDQRITGPAFTFLSPLTSSYPGGSVLLNSQDAVDAFVALNRGKQLQITGALTITGADIKSLSGLSNIISVSNSLSISAAPLLTDLSFLNGITTVGGGISLSNLTATTVSMDNLTGTTGTIDVSACKNLQSLSFKSLSNILGNATRGGINITGSPELTNLDFSNLRDVKYGITVSGTALVDFSKFTALKAAGELLISSNPSLISLNGLENLNTLTMTAYTSGILGGTATSNGLKILSNPKLSSLAGLKNLGTAPIAQISLNQSLNGLCPMKALLISLSTTPDYIYRSNSLDLPRRTQTFQALTLTSNGSYTTEADALKALGECK